MIEYKFTLDLTKGGIQRSIYAKAGENQARKLIITLTHSGGVFDVQDCSAEVYFDTNTFSQAEIRNNAVEFTIPAGLAEGTITCELKIFKGDTQAIFSPMFEIVVEESVGNNGETQALGEPIVYQKVLSGAEVKADDMQSEDYVIVFDYDKQVAMKLPWSKVKELLVVTSHSVLEGRDAENQHPILAITGLQDIIDDFGETVEEMTESINKNTEANHTHLYRGGESNKDVLDALSSLDGKNLYFNGEKVRNDNALTDMQKKWIEDAHLAQHSHKSTDNGEDNLFVLEGFSEDTESLRPKYCDQPLAFFSDLGDVDGLSEEQASNLAKNTEARHSHNNKDVLDKLGINNAGTRPTFQGEVIATQGDVASRMAEVNSNLYSNYYTKAQIDEAVASIGGTERPTATKTFSRSNGDVETTAVSSLGIIYLWFWSLPEGLDYDTEIKEIKIKILDVTDGYGDFDENGNPDGYVDIRELSTVDGNPVFVCSSKKIFFNETDVGGDVFCSFFCPDSSGVAYKKLQGLADYSVKITYYTD